MTTVLLSSIPYDYTEQRITEIASSVGPITLLKLLFDSDTGRSRGLCIVEYADSETAASAVRNLSGYQVENNRTLRCTFIDNTGIEQLLSDGRTNVTDTTGGKFGVLLASMDKDIQLSKKLPPLPPGIQIEDKNPENLNSVVYNVLANMGQQRLKNLLNDAKEMADEWPDLMRVLLKENPQLTTALVQGALLLELCDADDIKNIMITEEEEVSGANETENISENNEISEDKSLSSNPLDKLSPEQREMIEGIIKMSEEEIKAQIPEEQQSLYLEIKSKYGANI
ncbi:Rna15 protein [Martiniozyma asiatica (nom. inval.)]|nr:Rna15 protein [Martiniozyma asiatica]